MLCIIWLFLGSWRLRRKRTESSSSVSYPRVHSSWVQRALHLCTLHSINLSIHNAPDPKLGEMKFPCCFVNSFKLSVPTGKQPSRTLPATPAGRTLQTTMLFLWQGLTQPLRRENFIRNYSAASDTGWRRVCLALPQAVGGSHQLPCQSCQARPWALLHTQKTLRIQGQG